MNLHNTKLVREMVLVLFVSFVFWAPWELTVLNQPNNFFIFAISTNLKYYLSKAPLVLLRVVYKILSIDWPSGRGLPLYVFILVYVLLMRIILLYMAQFKWKYFIWIIILVLCIFANILAGNMWIKYNS